MNNNNIITKFKILKYSKVSLILTTLLIFVTLSYAAPSGENIISGTVDIDRTTTNTTNITQTTNSSIINWDSFNVASSETVNFIMPNSSSTSLNRVIGNDSSNINGSINSNGQVFLVNQNGIYFSNTSSVNTAGFTASTLDITNDNFTNANYVFEGTSESSIINFGTITTNNAYTALLAKEVKNEGIIQATLGNIQLASGSKITLDINGNSLVKLTIDEGLLEALVENKGLIQADGGTVYLTTEALDEVLNGLVNNTGIIEANSIEEKDGEIILYAHGGTANIDGTLEAEDGFIETSGKELNVASTTEIIADTWLLDPTNLVIESSGGSTLPDTSVSATAIQNALSANIELQADDDITVNEDITWVNATKLTLTAGDKVYVNATIENTNSTTGGVYFNAANTTDKVIFGTDGKVIVNNVFQLQWINQGLNGTYELGRDIDAGVTKTDTINWGSEGFKPLGDISTRFGGFFDGQGYTISDLYINRSINYNTGLFAGINSNSIIKNISLFNVDIAGNKYVGGLVGYNHSGTIINSSSTGSVSGKNQVGGLVGNNESGNIENSYSSVTISGDGSNFGGLVGQNTNGGTITNSYSTGSISGDGSNFGGLVGYNSGTITNSYSTGSVTGNFTIGGLVGYNRSIITNSYSTGSIIASVNVNVGGLIGRNIKGTTTNSFWDTETSGKASSAGGIGKTTAELNDIDTYKDAGWDIEYLSEYISEKYSQAALTIGGSSIWKFFRLKEPVVTTTAVTTTFVTTAPVTTTNLHEKYIDDITSKVKTIKSTKNTEEYDDSLKNGNDVSSDINVLDNVVIVNTDAELIFNNLLAHTQPKSEIK